MKLQLKNVRLTFPVLWKAKAIGDGKPKFNGNVLLKPTDPQVKVLNDSIAQIAKDKWGKEAESILKVLRAQDRIFLHDGNLKAQYEGYEGMLYVSASNSARPSVRDANTTPLTEADGRPYSGCFVNFFIEIYAQDDKKWGKRINATLRGVQFVRDGDAFSGTPPASDDEFEDMSEGADAASLV